MLLAFVTILVLTGMAILFSVYSIFSPFIYEFKNILDYNVAYYGAISSIERSELILKNKKPGFEGSGGWIGTGSFGRLSDTLDNNFSITTGTNQGMRRNISSRTNRIPSTGNGNVDELLSYDDSFSGNNDSSNFNKLDYNNVENFILSVDTSTTGFYYKSNGTSRDYYGGNNISGIFRLAPKVKSGFNNLDLCVDCDVDGDGITDDIIIDRSLKGKINGDLFTILPNITNFDDDTSIRESKINNSNNINFSNGFNIFNNSVNPSSHNYISSTNIGGDNFETIFNSTNYTGLELKFGLVNLLKTDEGNIYPFLEYYFEFGTGVSDRFYTIEGNGMKGEYNVKIIIKKPTFKENVAGSFTVVF